MKLQLPLSILSAALFAAPSVFGQAYSDPVGFVTVSALGNSDTRISAPLSRSAVYSGAVASVSGADITLQGSPGFSSNQFVYTAGTQPNTFYVRFNSGLKAGMYYTVVGNTTGVLSLDLAGDTLSGVLVSGDTLSIIPYWTLSTLFPGQAGITTTTAVNGTGALTQVLLPDVTTAGIDLASPSVFYYYAGTGFGGAGWRKIGGGFTTKRDDEVVLPDSFLIIRQNGVAANSSITVAGSVATHQRAVIVNVNLPNTPQDNAVAVDIPVGMTLTQSNLYQSGAFVGTTSINGSSGDRLLVWDDSVAGIDKAATKIYYYYTGTGFGGAGWRMLGGGFTTIRNDEVVLQAGTGVVIRKQSQVAASSSIWTVPLPYSTN